MSRRSTLAQGCISQALADSPSLAKAKSLSLSAWDTVAFSRQVDLSKKKVDFAT
jgi:hypothetical protein